MTAFYLAVGSVYGAADLVADKADQFLTRQGHQVEFVAHNPPEFFSELGDGVLLVITSTTGSGDLPDNLYPLFWALKERPPRFKRLRYGVIALGDSSYGDTYCGAGRQFDELLTDLGAERVGELLKIDASETFEPEQEALAWLPGWLEIVNEQGVGAA